MTVACAPARGWQLVELPLAGYLLAEGEEDALKDQHRTSAAQDGQGLTGKEAEDRASKGCAQEALQHTLKCRGGVAGTRHAVRMGVLGLPPLSGTAAGSCLHLLTLQGAGSGLREHRGWERMQDLGDAQDALGAPLVPWAEARGGHSGDLRAGLRGVVGASHNCTDLHVVSCIPQHTPEGDSVGDSRQVDVEHCREALRMQGIGEVTAIPLSLPPDVLHQPPKKPGAAKDDLRAVPAAGHSPLGQQQGRGQSLPRETLAQGGLDAVALCAVENQHPALSLAPYCTSHHPCPSRHPPACPLQLLPGVCPPKVGSLPSSCHVPIAMRLPIGLVHSGPVAEQRWRQASDWSPQYSATSRRCYEGTRRMEVGQG